MNILSFFLSLFGICFVLHFWDVFNFLSVLLAFYQGHKNVNRAIIHVDETQGDTFKLLVEGDDLLSVMSTVG